MKSASAFLNSIRPETIFCHYYLILTLQRSFSGTASFRHAVKNEEKMFLYGDSVMKHNLPLASGTLEAEICGGFIVFVKDTLCSVTYGIVVTLLICSFGQTHSHNLCTPSALEVLKLLLFSQFPSSRRMFSS